MAHFTQQWKALIIRITTFIVKEKKSLHTHHTLKACLRVPLMILAEMFLAILSLPFYFSKNSPVTHAEHQKHYTVKRIIGMSAFGLIILIWIAKLILAIGLMTYMPKAIPLTASSQAVVQSDEEKILALTIQTAALDTTLITPRITSLLQDAKGTLTILGMSNPDTTILVTLTKTPASSKKEHARTYRTISNANGQWRITEDHGILALQPGSYTATTLAYNEANRTRSAVSDATSFDVMSPLWKEVAKNTQSTLTLSIIVLLIVGIVTTVLTI